jgi:hypothetical protein
LNQITPANVKNLQARWAVQMPGDGIVESVPLVVDGIMYIHGARCSDRPPTLAL